MASQTPGCLPFGSDHVSGGKETGTACAEYPSDRCAATVVASHTCLMPFPSSMLGSKVSGPRVIGPLDEARYGVVTLAVLGRQVQSRVPPDRMVTVENPYLAGAGIAGGVRAANGHYLGIDGE